MTHIYIATRAPKMLRDIWLANMQSQFSVWERENIQTKQKEKWGVQWNIKPIELWEIVVPDEAVNEVLWWLKIKGDGKQDHPQLEKLAWGMRKGLGLQKIPKYDANKLQINPTRMIMNEHMSIYGIGIKKDDVKEFPQWGYKQEGL